MSQAADSALYVERLDPGSGPGLRVAVKDLVDLQGMPTSSGCRAVAAGAEPADEDADCLAGFRKAGARWTGKVNLHELAYGVTGENPWYGTPVNPLDPSLMPGGSSSGSAVAVAIGEADVAIGTDTGGSIRIPAACCGVAGLKTTVGRIPLRGVRALAPSFDTVGLLARDVASLSRAFPLLCGCAEPADDSDVTVGRVVGLTDIDEDVDMAVDRALAAAGLASSSVRLDGWAGAFAAHRVILGAEAWGSNGALLDGNSAAMVGTDVKAQLERASRITASDIEEARAVGET
ncbi:MAG TPA: amidase family protein, partial [Acidimicrobiales bacterium]|nr:amidase family protein [Acidimicrobiales bacterium]